MDPPKRNWVDWVAFRKWYQMGLVRFLWCLDPPYFGYTDEDVVEASEVLSLVESSHLRAALVNIRNVASGWTTKHCFFSVILLGETHLFNIAKMYFTIGRYDSLKKHCKACCTEVYLGKYCISLKTYYKNMSFFFFRVKLKVREALCSQNPSHLRLDEGAKAALKAVPGLQVGRCYKTASRHGCIYQWQMFDPQPPAGPRSLSHSGGRQCQHQEFFGKLPSHMFFFVDGKSGCNSERKKSTQLAGTPRLMSRQSAERFGVRFVSKRQRRGDSGDIYSHEYVECIGNTVYLCWGVAGFKNWGVTCGCHMMSFQLEAAARLQSRMEWKRSFLRRLE